MSYILQLLVYIHGIQNLWNFHCQKTCQYEIADHLCLCVEMKSNLYHVDELMNGNIIKRGA